MRVIKGDGRKKSWEIKQTKKTKKQKAKNM